MTTARDMAMGHIGSLLQAGFHRAEAATVATLQPRVLTLPQLDAVQQIQQAMHSIESLRAAINQLATLHALPVRRIGLHEVGMLHAELEALLWESSRTADMLQRGGYSAEHLPANPPRLTDLPDNAGRIAA